MSKQKSSQGKKQGKIDFLARHKGRELTLMALFALEEVSEKQQFQAIERFWLIFDRPEAWKALFDTSQPSHPLLGPPLWNVFKELPLEAPVTPYSLHKRPARAKQFAQSLLEGIIPEKTVLDQQIAQFSQGWKVSRMPRIDLNILRIGTYELLFRDDIPNAVAINEALELSKTYSTERARKFIHGLLDNIRKSHQRR